MAASSSYRWADQSASLINPQIPYLRISFVTVYVRDQDRSLRFYLDQLGFTLSFDARPESGQRWVTVAPPDGTALLALVAPAPGSENYGMIGRPTQIVLVTENISGKYEEWLARGVRFHHPPRATPWEESSRPSRMSMETPSRSSASTR